MTRSAHPVAPGQPASSLQARRLKLAELLRASRGPWWRDPSRRVVFLCPLISPPLLTYAVLSMRQSAWLMFACHLGLVVGRGVEWLGKEAQDRSMLRSLDRVIVAEHATAAVLMQLEAQGWSVLHDRALGETGQRVAHIAVGPAGIVMLRPFVAEVRPVSYGSSGYTCPSGELLGRLPASLRWSPATVTDVAVGYSPLDDWWRLKDNVCGLEDLLATLKAMPAVLADSARPLVTSLADELCPRLLTQPQLSV